MEPTRHKACMNVRCEAIESAAWKRGWRLRSGDRADLCTDCGSAFELSRFCEKFHAYDPGWRSCIACGKGLHCGCIASIHLFVLLDTGGVSCRGCVDLRESRNVQGILGGFSYDSDLGKEQEENLILKPKSEVDFEQKMAATGSEDEKVRGVAEELSAKREVTYMEEMEKLAVTRESPGTQTEVASLNTSLGLGMGIKVDDTAAGNLFQTESPASGGEAKENPSKYSPIPYRPRHRQVGKQPVPPRVPLSGAAPEPTNDPRVARPPADSKGRNQLLPRYWPRITDQEIQQFTSGDSKITPLFEKVLSASDAGRIGRLVLPKACAEAYFPTISQAEGLPLRINDISGREWQFQFRFWPNNNSRMYVLEGVTPCIQAMHLQAGDTVTFSRLEPEGKLIMGYRKAQPLQDSGDSEYPGAKQTDYKSKAKETQSTLSADKRRGRPLGAKSKRLRLDSEDSLELKTSWEEAQELLRPPPGVTPSFVTIDGHQFEEYEEPPVLTKKTVTRTKPSGEQDRWVQCDDCAKFRRVPLDIFIHTRWTCTDNVWDLKRANCSAAKELSNEDMDQLMDSMSGKPGKAASSPSGLDALATAAAFGDEKAASPPPPAATTKHPRHRPGCTCIVCIQPPSGKGPKHKPTCVCNVCLTVKRRFKTLMMRRKKRQSEREAETARKKKAWDKDDGVAAAASPAEAKWLKGNNNNNNVTTTPERGQQRYNTREASAPPKASPALPAESPSPSPSPINPINPFVTERGKTFPFPELLGAFASPPVPGGGVGGGGGGATAVADENLAGKGGIDLNSQPERDEAAQQSRLSMMRLLQDASLPLDMYLKQQGMANLAPGFGGGGNGGGSGGGGGGEQVSDAKQQIQQAAAEPSSVQDG
ncbi:B3 domain-containing protein Os07g0563300 isoform X1 [Selaginella moellendorffii]|uniref:B3 domain-containing protein Os07g0563300 isoform X1 n=1 Tax=Selaginella moellendorffii TaxID=88036 RepID=UPI000D1CD014|nr:B3 domain-containing protein Os07g0563300 isoform X1 [Selaginella moellendorffii]|eukprot:XP_024528328.1 B3 domain-containing protein Os07g0563300 isoform X1 [Selaginella moellendorffii]